MLVNAGALAAHSFKNSSQKATINYTKEIKNLVLPSVYVALSLLAWYFLPDLRSVLTFFVGSAIFLLLYRIHHFTNNAYQCHKSKRGIYNENEKAIKALIIASADKAILTTSCHKQIESLPDNIPEFVLESLKKFSVQNPQKAFELIMCVK